MNYGSNITLLEMDTKNRYGASARRTHMARRKTSTESDGDRSNQNIFRMVTEVPAIAKLASLVSTVVVTGAIASAAIVA